MMENKIFSDKGINRDKTKIQRSGSKTKKKWVPQNKHFEGSVGEGVGFAFKRKQKTKHEYIKLMRKERKKYPTPQNVYKDEYPEHLKHLYLEEKEKLKKEAWMHRLNRSKVRMRDKGEEQPNDEDDHRNPPQSGLNTENPSISEDVTSNVDTVQTTGPSGIEDQTSIPMSNRMRKKQQRKTSYQKTQEEFERRRENQRRKQEEYLKNKKQREEAIQKYKQKKMETYQMLCKRTKKGQPNLNLQMEFLLQKIQRTDK